jgi:hypothetical protein
LADNQKATDLAEIVKGLDYLGKSLPTGVCTDSEEQFPGAFQGYIRLKRGLQIHQSPELYWMSLAKEAIQSKRAGTTVGVPQVLMNYARVSRGPWRLKALLDRKGRPVASRFITVRPRSCSLEVVWALLNSPIANHRSVRALFLLGRQVSPPPRIVPARRSTRTCCRSFRAGTGVGSGADLRADPG